MKGHTRPCVIEVYPQGCEGRQRGASLVVMAVSIVALVSALLAALDIGQLYSSQRTLQRQANMAALDAVRVVSGCTGSDTANRAGDALAVAQQSLIRNFGDPVLLSASGFKIGNVLPGTTPGNNGLRSFALGTSAGDADAVMIELTRNMPTSLVRAFSRQPNGILYAQAVAQNTDVAGIAIGTGLITIDTAKSAVLNSLVKGLTGQSISLSAVDYRGLISARVTPAGLMQAANISDISGLNALAGTGLLNAIKTTVANDAPQSAAAVSTLANSLSGIIGSVALGQVFDLPEGLSSTAAQNVGIDPFNLLVGLAEAAQVAQGSVPLPLVLPTVNVPGVVSLTAQLKVLEGPQFKVGRPGRDTDGSYFTQVTSSQVLVTVKLNLLGPVLGSALPAGVGVNGGINLDLTLSVAGGSAGLASIECARAGRPFHNVMIDAQSDIARAAVGIVTGGAASINNPLFTVQPSNVLNLNLADSLFGLGALLSPLINVTATVDAASAIDVSPGTSGTLDYQVSASDTLPLVQTISAPLGASLNSALMRLLQNLTVTPNVTVNVLNNSPLVPPSLINSIASTATNLVLNTVVPVVVSTLSGVVGPLATDVLDPLLEALGVSFGNADVMLTSISVDQPQLVRTTVRN